MTDSNSSSQNSLFRSSNNLSKTHLLAEETVFVRSKVKFLNKTLIKLENPRSVLIIAKNFDNAIVDFTKRLTIFFIETSWKHCQESSINLKVYIDSKLDYLNSPFQELKESEKFKDSLFFWDREFCLNNAEEIDMIITLGGDGTVLYASWLFQNAQVPPVIAFHLGSLGFLTNFTVNEIKSVLNKVVGCEGDGVHINMRMRLQCTVWRANKNLKTDVAILQTSSHENIEISKKKIDYLATEDIFSGLRIHQLKKPHPVETFHILNDLVIDRGPSAYMSQLELYVDEKHLTTVQADGLVISTPTGATAYSLSAGGPLAHPLVPSILVTPICPHTLSFRPMLLPDSVELRIEVPSDSRNSAFVSFDGRHRTELLKGDSVRILLSPYPLPTVCKKDQGEDWISSLSRCLHWNERARQKPFSNGETILEGFPHCDDDNYNNSKK
ncbi:hypothetical protein HK099_005661 [Clydaea vesicula]|uniref:NAD(+) kinase n=1 Tax=Clydaea vesicula TaxID=447962 RepID=A0AAD5TYH8_9FUNG|nr:hypothetical protein HK099_005661 [Clydaea vesicula]KAJ3397307.1 hypothetical protein HDU92_008848 [Lobulomyces angularis]